MEQDSFANDLLTYVFVRKQYRDDMCYMSFLKPYISVHYIYNDQLFIWIRGSF